MEPKSGAFGRERWLSQLDDDDEVPILSFRSKVGLKPKKKNLNNSKERFQISELNLDDESSKTQTEEEPALLVKTSIARRQKSFFESMLVLLFSFSFPPLTVKSIIALFMPVILY